MLIFILYASISIIVINIIGKIITTITNVYVDKFYFQLFVEQIIGTTFIVTFYSILKTKGETINLLFLLITTYIFVISNSHKLNFAKFFYIKFKYLKYNYLVLLLILIPIFLFEYFNLISFSEFKLPHIDSFYYSEISNSLNLTGNENLNNSLNIISPLKFDGIQPYHYYELWLNSFFIELFHTSAVYSLLLITYPCLIAIVFIGFIAIWESIHKVNFWTFLFVLILLFTDGIFFAYNQSIPYMNNYSTWTTLFSTFGQKFAPVFMFFVLFILLFINNYKKIAFLVLGCILIVSPTFIPGVSLGVVSFLFLNKFHKSLFKNDNLKIISFYVILFIAFALIYFFFGQRNTENNHNIFEVLRSTFSKSLHLSRLKYICGMMTYRLNRTFVLFSPYIIICFVLYTINSKNFELNKLVIFVIFCNLGGLITYGILADTLNSSQLFTNTIVITTSFIMCFCIYSFIDFLKNWTNPRKIIYLSCFLVILFLNYINFINILKFNLSEIRKQYSNEYMNSVFTEIKNKPKLLIAALYPTSEQRFYSVSKLGRFILFTYGYKDVININDYCLFDCISKLDNNIIPYLLKSEFYLFINEQKKNSSFSSFEKSQIEFIYKYHINYVFVSKDVYISPLLKREFKRKIVDSYSGEQFYILK